MKCLQLTAKSHYSSPPKNKNWAKTKNHPKKNHPGFAPNAKDKDHLGARLAASYHQKKMDIFVFILQPKYNGSIDVDYSDKSDDSITSYPCK